MTAGTRISRGRFRAGRYDQGRFSGRPAPGGAAVGAAEFGANTLAGAGAVAAPGGVTSVTDAGGTNLVLSGGGLVPGGAGGVLPGTVLFDDGSSVVVTTIADTYSVSADMAELAAAWADAGTGAKGILVRGGVAPPAPRTVLPAKAFTGEFVIEPHIWAASADPRNSTRSAQLGLMRISAGTQNLRLRGVRVSGDLPAGETRANGVIELEFPLAGVAIEQNEISSASLAAEWSSGSFDSYANNPPLLRGVVSVSPGGEAGSGVSVTDNYIHDCDCGIGLWNVTASQVSRNYIVDVYSGFTVLGGQSDGVELFDNRMMHVWAATGDTPTPGDPLSVPQTAVGLTFEAPSPAGRFQNCDIAGNFAHIGWRRGKLHADGALPAPVMNIKGMTFDGPGQPDAFGNITIRHNLVVAHGVSIGGVAGDGFEIYNNTAVSESFAGTGPAIHEYSGLTNSRLYRNISEAFRPGAADGGLIGGVALEVTSDTLDGYSNVALSAGDGPVNRDAMFEGHASKGFDLLTLDDLAGAYAPVAGSYPLQQSERIGALATGYYSGAGGETGPAFAARAANAGVRYVAPLTIWDGTVRAEFAGTLANISDGRAFTFAWEGQFDPSTDGQAVNLLYCGAERLAVRRMASGRIQIIARSGDDTPVLEAETGMTITSRNGMARLAISVDLDQGFAKIALDGRVVPLTFSHVTQTGGIMALGALTGCYLHADSSFAGAFAGQFHQALLMDEYVDLDTVADLNRIFSADGGFVDWGTDGSAISAGAKPVVYRGDAATLNAGNGNGGNGGTFLITGGSVTEISTDTTAPAIAGSAPSAGATGVGVGADMTITFDEDVVFATGAITLRANTGVWSDAEVFDVATDTGTGPGTVGISGSVLTIRPTADMDAGTEYAVRIDPTAIEDTSGNAFGGISDDTTLGFATAGGAPETIAIGAAQFGDFSSVLPATAGEFVAAFRVQRLTDWNLGDPYLLSDGTGTGQTHCRIWAANTDQVFTRIETDTGAVVMNGAGGGTVLKNETASVFIRIAGGSAEVIVEGAAALSGSAAFSAIRVMRYLNTYDGAGAGGLAMNLIGGIYISTAAGCADPVTGLTYPDFFDAGGQPVFGTGAIKGFAPDLVVKTASDLAPFLN